MIDCSPACCCRSPALRRISDRIVIGSLIDQAVEHFRDNRSIEVIDVGGKNNFVEYTRLLDALKTPWNIVADRDYLEQIGGSQVKSLFQTDADSQWRSLVEDKKSLDRKALVDTLWQFVNDGEKERILELLVYLDSRHKRLKHNLKASEQDLLDAELQKWSSKGVELLKHGDGEIEDYMPARLTDIGAIVDMVSDKNWITSISDEPTRVHLGEIIGRILDVSKEILDPFIAKIQQQEEVFELPEDTQVAS